MKFHPLTAGLIDGLCVGRTERFADERNFFPVLLFFVLSQLSGCCVVDYFSMLGECNIDKMFFFLFTVGGSGFT